MERTKYHHQMRIIQLLIILLIINLSCWPLFAEKDTLTGKYFKEQIYNSYIAGNMGQWGVEIDMMEREYSTTRDEEIQEQLIFAYYGYIGYQIGNEEKDEAAEKLERLEFHLDYLLENASASDGWLYAMKGAAKGYRIGLSPYKAVFIGPSAMNDIDRAVETDSLHPLGWIEKGNSAYYRPALFGGSKEEALNYYLKASKLFTANYADLNGEWIYLNLQVLIAQCYTELENYNKALKTYDDLLRFEPGFSWVADELKPALELKIAEENE